MGGFLDRARQALSDTGKALSSKVDTTLHERGLAGTAFIESVKAMTVGGGDSVSGHVLKYRLRVTVPGWETYEVEYFEPEVADVDPGQTIPVKVDPNDPKNLLLDWNKVQAAKQAIDEQAQASLAAQIEAEKDPNHARNHMRTLVEQGHFTKEQFDEAARHQGWEPYDAG